MGKVILKGFIVVPEDELNIVIKALEKHVALTKQEPGCLVFNVNQRSHSPCYFDVYEEFSNNNAFEHHQRRVTASEWGRITVNVERHYEVWHTENN
ncbi:putative quinol monooxygenase [Photobacterium leiognathi]|uniref:putative quinol monooxygenase n=1 Tax=Photobacterium leiognathi TaxID=553611 RepID=UPI0027343BAF|nr:antibiotic biosynthesis monooxygenase [Photobacterium leiognathi]